MLGEDAFVSDAPVEREVNLGRSGKQKLWFREISDADWQRYSALRSSDDVEVKLQARSFIISKALCEPDGRLSMDQATAARLKLRFGKAIEDQILLIEAENRAEAGNDSAPGAAEPASGST